LSPVATRHHILDGAACTPGPQTRPQSVSVGARPGPHARMPFRSAPVAHDKEYRMVTYIGLLSFTDKGLSTIKDSTKRAAAAREAAKKTGVNMRDVFWTLGEYDVICVLEAEDEAALAAFSIATAQQGNVRTRTLRAFSAADMDKILAKVK
jgi:uncharacterized protein with GYD domain